MSDQTDEPTDEDVERIVKHLTDTIEFYKVRVDLFKHLSTLSSGSIVVLVAFSKDLLSSGSNSFIVAAMVGLIVTILFSTWTCFQTLGLMMKTKELISGISSYEDLVAIEQGRWVNFVAMVSFLLSMIFLVISLLQKIP